MGVATGGRHVALVYVRKSVVRTGRDELSPERQRAACLAYCESRGWTPEVYEDAEGHRSGRSEEHRPEWRKLKKQLGRPDVVAVVANSLDRLSRSPSDFFRFLEELQRNGVELVSLSEQFDTSTAIGRAFLAILMVIASLESDMAAERVSATIAYRKSQGIHWGYTPFGYDRNERGILVPNADAPAARACLERYACGDVSFLRVAGILNRMGFAFRSRDGLRTEWTRNSVRSVVSNVLIYAGYIPNGRGKDARFPSATLESLVQETGAVRGQHEPLISEATARAIIAARRKRYEHRVRRDNRIYPLTTVLFCAECGSPLRGKLGRKGPEYTHHSGQACGQLPIPAEQIEAAVLYFVDQVLHLPDEFIQAARTVFRERLEARLRATAHQADLDRLLRQRKRLVATYLDGELEEGEYQTRRIALDNAIRQIEAQAGLGYDLDRILSQLPSLAGLIRMGSPALQRQALASIFARIEVANGDIKRAVPTEVWRPFFEDVQDSLRHIVPPREFESLSQP